jgi:hypothetical protein
MKNTGIWKGLCASIALVALLTACQTDGSTPKAVASAEQAPRCQTIANNGFVWVEEQMASDVKRASDATLAEQARRKQVIYSGRMTKTLQAAEGKTPGMRYQGPLEFEVSVAETEGMKEGARVVSQTDVRRIKVDTGGMIDAVLPGTAMFKVSRMALIPPPGYEIVTPPTPGHGMPEGSRENHVMPSDWTGGTIASCRATSQFVIRRVADPAARSAEVKK